MRRIEQRSDKSVKGMRRSLPKNRASLRPEAAADPNALIARMARVRTARAWAYRERLREILDRRHIHVVRVALQHGCTCVMRSKVEPKKQVATLARRYLDGIVAWVQARQVNGFLEARSGLFQAPKRRARSLTRFDTIGTVIFLLAGKVDFRAVDTHPSQPIRNSRVPEKSAIRARRAEGLASSQVRSGTCAWPRQVCPLRLLADGVLEAAGAQRVITRSGER